MIRSFIVTLLLSCCVAAVTAQQHRFGSWTELATKYVITKKWSAAGGVMTRLYPSAYNSQYIAEAGITRELVKRLELSGGCRFTLKDVGHEQRVQVDLSYAYRNFGFQLSDRVRYQYEWNERIEHANYIRNKTTLKYRKPKKITPMIAAEFFYRAGYRYRFIDQVRFFAGADFELSKQLDLGLQWIHTAELQVTNPLNTDVLYVGLTYDIE